MVREAGNPKVSATSDKVSGKNPLPGSQMAIFLLYSHGRRGELFQGPLIRALLSFVSAPSLWPTHFLKAPPSHTIASGLGFNLGILVEHKHSIYRRINTTSYSFKQRGFLYFVFLENVFPRENPEKFRKDSEKTHWQLAEFILKQIHLGYLGSKTLF